MYYLDPVFNAYISYLCIMSLIYEAVMCLELVFRTGTGALKIKLIAIKDVIFMMSCGQG